jgi:hypothetical protein
MNTKAFRKTSEGPFSSKGHFAPLLPRVFRLWGMKNRDGPARGCEQSGNLRISFTKLENENSLFPGKKARDFSTGFPFFRVSVLTRFQPVSCAASAVVPLPRNGSARVPYTLLDKRQA